MVARQQDNRRLVEHVADVDQSLALLRCKQLVDAGRLEWLRRRGYKASGVRYVAREVTPENHLLLGH